MRRLKAEIPQPPKFDKLIAVELSLAEIALLRAVLRPLTFTTGKKLVEEVGYTEADVDAITGTDALANMYAEASAILEDEGADV